MSNMGKTKGTKHLSVGKMGEDIAVAFLKKKSFRIIECNVNRKWGELDVVVAKNNRIHVVEVKAVSGTKDQSSMNPLENLTKHKIEKLQKTATLYCMEHRIENWQLDAVLVWYDAKNKRAQVEYIENIY